MTEQHKKEYKDYYINEHENLENLLAKINTAMHQFDITGRKNTIININGDEAGVLYRSIVSHKIEVECRLIEIKFAEEGKEREEQK